MHQSVKIESHQFLTDLLNNHIIIHCDLTFPIPETRHISFLSLFSFLKNTLEIIGDTLPRTERERGNVFKERKVFTLLAGMAEQSSAHLCKIYIHKKLDNMMILMTIIPCYRHHPLRLPLPYRSNEKKIDRSSFSQSWPSFAKIARVHALPNPYPMPDCTPSRTPVPRRDR